MSRALESGNIERNNDFSISLIDWKKFQLAGLFFCAFFCNYDLQAPSTY